MTARNPRVTTYRRKEMTNNERPNPVDLSDRLHELDAHELLDRIATALAEGDPGVHRLLAADARRLPLYHLLQQRLRGAA